MAKFFFRAKDWSGKTVKGVVDSADKIHVIESVRASGLTPLFVGEETNSILNQFVKKITSRVSLKEVATFTRQLSTMMTAGLPLTDALTLLKNQAESNASLYEIVDTCLTMVRGGQPLGKALEKYERVFGEAYVASINAGEEAGVLEAILEKLATNIENQNEFNGKVKGAMVYPAIVILGMFGVAVLMMVLVVPKLTQMYADFGTAKMPAATVLLMNMSDFVTKWWFMIPFIVFGIFAVMRVGDGYEAFRLKRDTYLLKIPIMGELSKKTMMANTLRTLSMLLTAGISLMDALRIVAKVAGNELYYQAYVRISERVQKGFSIASSFEEVGVFPLIVDQMVATGEATGKLDDVLMRASNYFATEAEQSVKTLTSAIEPLIMIVLGAGVAFLVIAVVMPIYNLTSSF